MIDFEDLWQTVVASKDGESVAPELRPLLLQTYASLTADPRDLLRVKASLEGLLVFLASPAGRTAANCVATDLFFTLADSSIERQALPDELALIVFDLGGALHDTFSAPKVAPNFNSLPEQLLLRIRQWVPD